MTFQLLQELWGETKPKKAHPGMSQAKSILVIGGYGAVGQYIVRHLHVALPKARLIVAGRNLEKAREFANSFSSRVSAVKVDLTVPGSIEAVLPKVSIVILNTEAGARTAALACADRAVSLVTVAASVAVMRTISDVSAKAEQAGALFVTEVGLAPGLANLMMQESVAEVSQVEGADLIVQLPASGKHGKEATIWTIERCKEAKRAVRLVPPHPAVGRYVIPIDFINTMKMQNELGVPRVCSWLALQPGWTARLLPRIAPLLASYPRILDLSQPVLSVFAGHADAFKLIVRARSSEQSVTMQLTGQNQSRVTGIVAARVAIHLQSGRSAGRSGVVEMSDILGLKDFLPDLEAVGCRLEKSDNGVRS